jgi:hypothetical protein
MLDRNWEYYSIANGTTGATIWKLGRSAWLEELQPHGYIIAVMQVPVATAGVG